MSECCDNPISLCQFPTELLVCIFKNLPAKHLVSCRQVCSRWKGVIDHLTNDDVLWEKYCERDYKTVYMEAKKKSNSCRLWFDVYRSLSLWGCLSDANELQGEFCDTSSEPDLISNLYVVENGIIAVEKSQIAVEYYDVATLEVTERNMLHEDCSRLVGLRYNALWGRGRYSVLMGQLHISRKPKSNQKFQDSNSTSIGEIQEDDEVIFYSTIFFLTDDRDVFFTDVSNHIYHYNIDGHNSTANLITRNCKEPIISLSFYNGYVTVLTTERNVYACKDDKFVRLFNLKRKRGRIFDCLRQYQLIEKMNWRMFYVWVDGFCINIPEGPLRYINLIKIYGDLFIIGCYTGVILIYYKPYVDGHLDFFSHKPFREYSFDEHDSYPDFTRCGIIAIDVIETKEGHKILIGTPERVIIITYIHNFEVHPSEAV